jgi:hypothetical protein
MPLQSKTFDRLPPTEKLDQMIEFYRQRNTDVTSFLWYLVPLADRLGDRVYAVAAASLSDSGLNVTADQLRALAAEMKTPEGRQRYAENRRLHIDSMVTSVKPPGPES